MKNKVFLLLVIASTVVMLLALNYGNAFADAKAVAKKKSTYAYAEAQVNNGNLDEETQTGGENSTSTANAFSLNFKGSWAKAQAIAGNSGGILVERTSKKRHIMPKDWGSTKFDFDSVVAEGDFACSLYAISGQPHKAGIRTWGSAKAFPTAAGDMSIFRIAVTDSAETTRFSGEIVVVDSSLNTTGDYGDNIGITSIILGDTILTTVNRYDTISWFRGPIDSLIIETELHGRSTNQPIPTLTQWGLIILVVLLIASAVFVALKRRKSAVLA